MAVKQLSSDETVNSFPIMGIGKLPEHLVPGGNWPDEPRIAEFLQEVRPLIAQIERAGRYPTLAWQPIAFGGFSAPLPEIQASRALMRLLQLALARHPVSPRPKFCSRVNRVLGAGEAGRIRPPTSSKLRKFGL